MDVPRTLSHIAIPHGLIEYKKYTSERCATKGDKAFGGVTAESRALIGDTRVANITCCFSS